MSKYYVAIEVRGRPEPDPDNGLASRPEPLPWCEEYDLPAASEAQAVQLAGALAHLGRDMLGYLGREATGQQGNKAISQKLEVAASGEDHAGQRVRGGGL